MKGTFTFLFLAMLITLGGCGITKGLSTTAPTVYIGFHEDKPIFPVDSNESIEKALAVGQEWMDLRHVKGHTFEPSQAFVFESEGEEAKKEKTIRFRIQNIETGEVFLQIHKISVRN